MPSPIPDDETAERGTAQAASGGLVLSLRGVSHRYAVSRRARAEDAGPDESGWALRSLDLDVPRGVRLAMLGPNGSGKSTLLKVCALQLTPREGRVSVMGESFDAAARPDAAVYRRVHSRIGVVFQTPALDSVLTVRENLRIEAALFALGRREAEERIGALAARLGVEDRLDDWVGELSGGLARRADLARVMLHGPDLLLLDEPTVGLDPTARAGFLDALDELRADRRPGDEMTVVLSTHLIDEAERCDVVAMLHEGRIVAMDSPGRLRERAGESVRLRCRASDAGSGARVESAMGEAGLAVVTEASGRIIGSSSDTAGMAAAAAGLIRAGVAFEVGPATLADVFASLTGGAALEQDLPGAGGADAKRGSRRARRTG